MKKVLTKVVASFLAVLMLTAVVASNAMAANFNNVKQYPHYVLLGDSVASGFGLPDYNRRGKFAVYAKDIEGSYGSLVADAVGAKANGTYYPRAYPGFTSSTFRYALTDNYSMREWEKNQLPNFSFGEYTPDVLANERNRIRSAVKKADLITVDLGVNDTWYGTIALVYEIAEHGTVIGLEPRETLQKELEKYGSWGTVLRNAAYYLAGFVESPTLWANFWGAWIENLLTYFVQYQDNYNAIIQGIYDLNPDVTVVCLSSANSFRNLNLTPGQKSGAYKISWLGAPVQVDIPLVGTVTLPDSVHISENPIANVTGVMYDFFYEPVRKAWEYKKPGQYYYADVGEYDMIMDHFVPPLFEFMSLDNSGFNPHATLSGNRYMAEKILEVLPTR